MRTTSCTAAGYCCHRLVSMCCQQHSSSVYITRMLPSILDQHQTDQLVSNGHSTCRLPHHAALGCNWRRQKGNYYYDTFGLKTSICAPKIGHFSPLDLDLWPWFSILSELRTKVPHMQTLWSNISCSCKRQEKNWKQMDGCDNFNVHNGQQTPNLNLMSHGTFDK